MEYEDYNKVIDIMESDNEISERIAIYTRYDIILEGTFIINEINYQEFI